MKICKKCRQSVNIDTVTCPRCESHEFKLSKLKICSLCGKINAAKNLNCDQCGKSFKSAANEYALATALSLNTSAEDYDFQEETPKTASKTVKTPEETYVEIKAEIERREDSENYAYFIPNSSNGQRPIIVMPSIKNELEKNIEVFFVMPTRENPNDLKMEKSGIFQESDINKLNQKQEKPAVKVNFPALFLFFINLAIICNFGFNMVEDVIGFQIIAALFLHNPAGQNVIDLIKADKIFGTFSPYLYLAALSVSILGMIAAAVFLSTKRNKTKKIILIVIQSIMLLLAICVYLIVPVILKGDYFNVGIGLLLLIAYSLISVIAAILYQYEGTEKAGIKNESKQEKKTEKGPKKIKEKKSSEVKKLTLEEEEIERLGSLEKREVSVKNEIEFAKKKKTEEKKRQKDEKKQKIKEKKDKDKESRLSNFNYEMDDSDGGIDL